MHLKRHNFQCGVIRNKLKRKTHRPKHKQIKGQRERNVTIDLDTIVNGLIDLNFAVMSCRVYPVKRSRSLASCLSQNGIHSDSVERLTSFHVPQIAMASLPMFTAATEFVANDRSLKLSDGVKLQFYAYFKVHSVAPPESAPIDLPHSCQ